MLLLRVEWVCECCISSRCVLSLFFVCAFFIKPVCGVLVRWYWIYDLVDKLMDC